MILQSNYLSISGIFYCTPHSLSMLGFINCLKIKSLTLLEKKKEEEVRYNIEFERK